MSDRASPGTLRFAAHGGHCEADLHLPQAPGAGPHPVVVMAHGIGAERDWGLAPFARRFSERGIAALVFDYRHFGGSSGTPRRLVSPSRQLADYRAALSFVREDPRLDATRVGLWGTSFSGGHVLRLATEAPAGVRAVVSQIPFVSGLASTLAFPLRYHLPAIALGLADTLRGLLGLEPLTVPVVRQRGLALLASPDSLDGYRALLPGNERPPPVPARTFLQVLRYHPGRHASRNPIPTLVLGASDDEVCPIGATRRVAARLPRGRIEELPIGHFDVYRGDWFEKASTRATAFLWEHLAPDAPGSALDHRTQNPDHHLEVDQESHHVHDRGDPG